MDDEAEIRRGVVVSADLCGRGAEETFAVTLRAADGVTRTFGARLPRGTVARRLGDPAGLSGAAVDLLDLYRG